MRMTIDEQIKALEYLKKCGIFPFSDTRTGIVITDEYVDGAIETMRKYQKIEGIVKSKTTRLSYDVGFEQIKKVIEDGKID